MPRGVTECLVRETEKIVANGRYTSRNPMSIDWVTVERGYDVDHPNI